MRRLIVPMVLAGLTGAAPVSDETAQLVALYKDLHAKPELAFQEVATAARLVKEITGLGYEITTGVGKTGIVAVMCCVAGIWAGIAVTRKFQKQPEPAPANIVPQMTFIPQGKALEQFNISPREYEVLVLMAQGMSNQEIASHLFLSLNTIKTHASNLFFKLDASRRTQAIEKAKSLALIP